MYGHRLQKIDPVMCNTKKDAAVVGVQDKVLESVTRKKKEKRVVDQHLLPQADTEKWPLALIYGLV